MAARTKRELRRELETERARLGTAVRTLRTQSGQVAKKLSLAAAGTAAVGIAARVLRRRREKKERPQFPFLGRD